MENTIYIYSGNEEKDMKSFGLLYQKYYNYLCSLAERFTLSKDISEESVNDVFLNLWNDRKRVEKLNSPVEFLSKKVLKLILLKEENYPQLENHFRIRKAM